MGLDTQVEVPTFVENVYATAGNESFISFMVDKWLIPGRNSACYIAILPLNPGVPSLDKLDKIDKVVDMAREVTLQLGSPDDLDIVPDVSKIPVDPVLYRFTHALEHLAVAHLAITLPSVLGKLQDGPAGKTTVYRESGKKRCFVGFSLTEGLPPTPLHELTSIKAACSAVAGLKS